MRFWMLIFAMGFFALGQSPAKHESRYIFEGIGLSENHVVLASSGSLWLIDRTSWVAEAITEATPRDQQPVCHPRGTHLAFMRTSATGGDLMLMDLQTREIRQLTYHPSRNWPVAWSNDGKRLLFASSRDRGPATRLYEMDLEGAWPEPLALPMGSEGTWLPDGRLVYVPHSRLPRFSEFRYYRGGLMSPLWLIELASGKLDQLTQATSNAYHPVHDGQRLLYLDDKSGTANLYTMSLNGGQASQLTHYKDHGIRDLAAHQSTVAFTRAGRVYLQGNGDNQPSDITPQLSLPKKHHQARTINARRWLIDIYWTRQDSLSLTARGDVFLSDANQAKARNITQTSAIAERNGQLSPDGKHLAYFSDAKQGYQLAIRELESGAEKLIQIESDPSIYDELAWSNDSQQLCFSSRRLTLWHYRLGGKAPSAIVTSKDPGQNRFAPAWSPDGRYLAYQNRLANRLPTLFLFDTKTATQHAVTSGAIHASEPAFDASGRYLYFLVSPNAAGDDFQWSLLSATHAGTRRETYLAAAILSPSDLSPLNGQQPNLALDWDKPHEIPLDAETVSNRLVHLDIGNHQIDSIWPGRPGILYLTVYVWRDPSTRGNQPTVNLFRLNLRNPGAMERIARNVRRVIVSPNGKQILYQTGDSWRRVTFEKVQPKREAFSFGALPKPLTPSEEWGQLFDETWRIGREMFYDPQHHGQDWQELGKFYRQFLSQVSQRRDLTLLLRRMLGHLSVSHIFVTDGLGNRNAESPNIGLLGADFEIDQNRYRFRKILRQIPLDLGLPPVNAPLDQPGNRVSEGSYLIAIDDEPITDDENLYERLWQQANRWIWLTISEHPDGRSPRKVHIRSLANESQLRTANWAAENRAKVAELSDGQLGYLHISGYDSRGIGAFEAGYYGQRDKRGLIIDQRDNGGGTTADALIELITRKPLYAYRFRRGMDLPVPVMPPMGSRVLVTNFWNTSAAETFALMFQNANVGPIVGNATYGAGIGPWGWRNQLIDGANVQVPNRAAYDPAGTWGIENIGVQPTIGITLTPQLWRAGRDPYLEQAVAAALKARAPDYQLKAPAFPVHP